MEGLVPDLTVTASRISAAEAFTRRAVSRPSLAMIFPEALASSRIA